MKTLSEKILYQGKTTTSYLFQNLESKSWQIAKVLSTNFLSEGDLQIFENECFISNILSIKGLRKVIQKSTFRGQKALFFEFVNGKTFSHYFKKKQRNLAQFLSIAIQITSSLEKLHHQNIIHQNITGENILIEKNTQNITIIDLGFAKQCQSKNQISPQKIQGTLTHLAPEQTGRIEQDVDYRVDLYALGITFYEALTGVLPFQTTDELELIHSHLAKTPVPICEINPSIPAILNAIIMRLLEKNADHRYQSAYGLKYDLKIALKQFNTLGTINEFDLGIKDFVGTLIFPQKLYGREYDKIKLFSTYENCLKGTNKLLLIEGYSGVGKTAFVYELRTPTFNKGGIFIKGKFNLYQANSPYSAWIEATNNLVNELLIKSSVELLEWKSTILQALNGLGKLLTDVIPSLKLIIGEQLPVPELSSFEAQIRFDYVFLNFIRAISKEKNPLVIFLDDLQWVDGASLMLLRAILIDSDLKSILIVGAYRDNEVDDAHTLKVMLDNLKNERVNYEVILLSAICEKELNNFIADTLHCKIADSFWLSQLIFSKTEGNAFFTRQLLHSLVEQNLLSFDKDQHNWIWDINALQSVDITDNVTELMIRKIQKLPIESQHLLKVASHFGISFTIDKLKQVLNKSDEEIFMNLYSAICAGMIQKKNDSFCFIHDRIREAAYSLMVDSEKVFLHLTIARWLLKTTNTETSPSQFFEMVNHYNHCLAYITNSQERLQVSQLNYQAGIRAKNSAAFETAYNFFQIGQSLLPKNKWQKMYKQTLSLLTKTGETGYLIDKSEQADEYFKQICENAQTVLDKVGIFQAKMSNLTVLHQTQAALQLGRTLLRLLDLDFPEKVESSFIEQELVLINRFLEQTSIEELYFLPELKDEQQLAIAQILMHCTAPSYISDPASFPLIVLKLLNLSLQKGNSTYSAYAYAIYGVMLCGIFENSQDGVRMGKLALRILDKFNAQELKCKVYFLYGNMISFWRNPLKNDLNFLWESYQSGIATGDFAFASYALNHFMFHLVFVGTPLNEIQKKFESLFEPMRKLKQLISTQEYQLWQQTITCMMDKKLLIQGDFFDEEQIIPQWIEANDLNGLAFYSMAKLFLYYYYELYQEGLQVAQESQTYIDSVVGQIFVPQFYFYKALCIYALYESWSEKEQAIYAPIVEDIETKMKTWSQSSPTNFTNKYCLLLAESARIKKEFYAAIELYDSAIESAKDSNFLHEIALTNELAGKFYIQQKRQRIAEFYFQDSLIYYQQWGLIPKIKDLEQNYDFLFPLTTSIAVEPLSHIDMISSIKAVQSISQEIETDKLLTDLMRIMLENAGAERGFLIIESKQSWWVEIQKELGFDLVPLESCDKLSKGIVYYVIRTFEKVILKNASQEGAFVSDGYVLEKQPKSVLCIPLITSGNLKGILYLENNLAIGTFTSQRVNILEILATQAAISMENAYYYDKLKKTNQSLEQEIIERKQIEDELKRHREHLEDLVEERTVKLQEEIAERRRAEIIAENANHAKSVFLANMSHELRTPLNAILGYAQILKMDSQFTENQLRGINTIQRSGEHLLQMINEILDLAKIEANQMELVPVNFDFSECLKDIVEMISIKAQEKGIVLETVFDSNLPQFLYAEEKRLKQVLINLLNNSIKFTLKGKVILRVKKVISFIRFEIEDTGVGIAADKLDEIFEAFYQVGELKNYTEGTGLGLSISRNIIRMMQSELYVKSVLGKGSMFWFDLVLPESEVQTLLIPQRKEFNCLKINGNQHKILIVDDNVDNVSVLKDLLILFDFVTETATNGLEAIAKAKTFLPDVILMDILMPLMNGVEATRQIRKIPSFKTILIIAISASTNHEKQGVNTKTGFDEFLFKPIEAEQLLTILQKRLNLEFSLEKPTKTGLNSQNKSLPLVFPSKTELDTLVQAAKIGDITAFTTWIESAKMKQTYLQPFVEKLQQYLNTYQFDLIIEFLTRK